LVISGQTSALDFINSQKIKNVSKEVVIDFIKKNFVLEDGWERLMNVYWDLLV
jgi:hypothetical protein